MGWTKLDNGIIHSTIWRESKPTRLVWITMLAMVNKNGNVCAALPGLADAARVTIEECQAALETLKAPDPWSRTKEHEGRRIEEIDGGWFLYNHAKYRGPFVAEKKREANRMRQQKYRDKHNADGVTHNAPSRCNAHADTDTDTDTEEDKSKKESKPKKPTPPPYPEDFERFWQSWPGPNRTGKQDALKAWKKAEKNGMPPADKLILILINQDLTRKRAEAAGGFVPPWKLPSTWLNKGCWEDEFKADAPPSQPKSKFRQEMDLLDSIINSEDEQPPVKVTGTTEVVG